MTLVKSRRTIRAVDIPLPREIEALADAFRKRHPVQCPPLEVETLAGIAGIVDITVSDRISGSALLVGGLAGTYGIVLNRNEGRVRHRFSIAHEIGHRVIHPDRSAHKFLETIAARTRSRNQVETACNYFAGCLLMPREWVNRRAATAESAGELARVFDVSVPAMRVRLREIGLHSLARK